MAQVCVCVFLLCKPIRQTRDIRKRDTGQRLRNAENAENRKVNLLRRINNKEEMKEARWDPLISWNTDIANTWHTELTMSLIKLCMYTFLVKNCILNTEFLNTRKTYIYIRKMKPHHELAQLVIVENYTKRILVSSLIENRVWHGCNFLI